MTGFLMQKHDISDEKMISLIDHTRKSTNLVRTFIDVRLQTVKGRCKNTHRNSAHFHSTLCPCRYAHIGRRYEFVRGCITAHYVTLLYNILSPLVGEG